MFLKKQFNYSIGDTCFLVPPTNNKLDPRPSKTVPSGVARVPSLPTTLRLGANNIIFAPPSTKTAKCEVKRKS